MRTCNIVKMVTMLEVECLTRGHAPLSPTCTGLYIHVGKTRLRSCMSKMCYRAV